MKAPDTRCTRAPALALLLIPSACSGPELYVENDVFAGSDKDYTSGVRLQNTLTAADTPELLRDVTRIMRPLKDQDPTEVGFVIGHHIYTPEDTDATALIPDDRPYTGWLYAGLARFDSDFKESSDPSNDDVTTVELLLGVIGPLAQGEEFQNGIHDLIGSDEAMGWDNQLDDEITAMIAAQRQVRSLAGGLGPIKFDLLSRASLSVGTPFTEAEIGETLRLGLWLPRDFGVSVNEPALVSPATVRRYQRERSFYVFGDAAGRVVGYNSFLDGNLDGDSHSVDRELFVADLALGAALQLNRFRMAYTLVYRTPEFEEQDEGQVFGSFSIGLTERSQ